MCGGASYLDGSGKLWKVYFPSPKAALPIKKSDGSIEWVKWGKRKEELAKGFIQGGWARIDSIRQGKWESLNPKPAILAIQAFMEKDAERTSHWIDVSEGSAVQGLLATLNDETRLYVVTEDTPPEFSWVHDRWPRLVPQKVHSGI